MFKGASNLRKLSEAVSAPTHFQDLVGYDTVQGRPLSTVTSGFYTPVMVNLSMTPPAQEQLTPFNVVAGSYK